MPTKQALTGAGTSWGVASGVSTSLASGVHLYNDATPVSGTHAPIVADSGTISNNEPFMYREEIATNTWHAGTPSGWKYYVLEEV